MPFASINFKENFSLPSGSIYLNCAAQGPLCRPASEAVVLSMHDKEHPAMMDNLYGVSRVERFRKAVGELIDCDPRFVALANSTSWGINLIAQGLRLKAGDEILFFAGQFPANAAPWEPLVKKGISIHRIASDNFLFDMNTFVAALTAKTKVVSLEWVHFASGDRIPLRDITEVCHKRGIFVIVDGTQGVGAIPFSMKDTAVDALACSAYKWLYSPYGTGFLALRPEFMNEIESTYINWLSLDQEFSETLSDYKVQFCSGARRFDTSSQMGYLNLDGMIAAVEWLNTLNIADNFSYVRNLCAQIDEGLNKEKFELRNVGGSERQSCILSYACPTVDAERLVLAAQKENISFCVRNKGIRLSPSIYNDAQEMTRFISFVNQST